MMKLLPLALLLGACVPMHPHDMPFMNDPDESSDTEEDTMHMHKKSIWPTVRIEQPAGAHVTMEPGVFGDGIDVMAPFQASFQPTGAKKRAAYALKVELDESSARRYGLPHAVLLKGWLTVPETLTRQGILRIAPSECEMRALLNGDIDELKVEAEEMPTPEMACAARAAKQSGHEDKMSCGDHGCGCGDHGRPSQQAKQAQMSWQGAWHGWMSHGRGWHGQKDAAALMLRVAKQP